MNKRKVGSGFERLAARYMESQGFRILEMNFICSFGEVDIIAREGKTIVFAEVKYRSDFVSGTPGEAVTGAKQIRISNACSYYCYKHGFSPDTPVRFDVVEVTQGRIRIIRNAFPYCGRFKV